MEQKKEKPPAALTREKKGLPYVALLFCLACYYPLLLSKIKRLGLTWVSGINDTWSRYLALPTEACKSVIKDLDHNIPTYLPLALAALVAMPLATL